MVGGELGGKGLQPTNPSRGEFEWEGRGLDDHVHLGGSYIC